MLLAASALGYAAMWRTGAMAYHADVKHYLGLEQTDRIVAVAYLGRSGAVEPRAAARKAPNIRWQH